ncbi:Lipopolysaccharide core heptosyltransferase RfaQ [termite gut metagenome]|uniref:Lipopolysaccharide core heptosyltransferase RfaQ n=1 Tax=termite gut metagenome TaxID=433724 RepID=A0A5J4QY42_9ZZZZ
MAKFLVIRFSALGDVAMTIPVIYSFAIQYPQHEIVMLSRPVWETIFRMLPNNVSFLCADLKGKHKGIGGLNRLFCQLWGMNFDYVVDLHDVLRSQYLCFRFKLSGVLTGVLNKGRAEKKKLVRRHRKVLENQKSSFYRYSDVFEYLGFPFYLNFISIYENLKEKPPQLQPIIGEKGNTIWVGIAPFAKHKGKIYPLKLQEQVVAHFSKDRRVKVFLFGGGEREEKILDEWVTKYPSIISVAGKIRIEGELALMSQLDVMLSMDSANMHLASLVNIPVISIWGATHPYAGFKGWNQTTENCIQTKLDCRPCSVFGNKKCFRGDYACWFGIEPEQIIKKIQTVIY